MVKPLTETTGFVPLPDEVEAKPGERPAESSEATVTPVEEKVSTSAPETTAGAVSTDSTLQATDTPAPSQSQNLDLSFLSNVGELLAANPDTSIEEMQGAEGLDQAQRQAQEANQTRVEGLRGLLPDNTSVDTSGWELRTGEVDIAGKKYVPVLASLTNPDPPKNANLVKNKDGSASLNFDRRDIKDLSKVVLTEWVTSQGEDQGRGIIDTILNRVASGRWGNSLKSVVDAPKQFSAVNGGIAFNGKVARGVDDISDSVLSSEKGQMVQAFVTNYLNERANGRESVIGDNLNYANREHSTPNNYKWIDRLDGPKLGAHKHGTTDDLQKFRPGKFGISFTDKPEPRLSVDTAKSRMSVLSSLVAD